MTDFFHPVLSEAGKIVTDKITPNKRFGTLFPLCVKYYPEWCHDFIVKNELRAPQGGMSGVLPRGVSNLPLYCYKYTNVALSLIQREYCRTIACLLIY